MQKIKKEYVAEVLLTDYSKVARGTRLELYHLIHIRPIGHVLFPLD